MSTQEFQVNYEKKGLPSTWLRNGLIFLVLGIGLSAAAYFIEPQRALINGVVAYMFVFGCGIASLFLIALEYIVGAVWSVPFRRISEFLAALLFIAPVLALPAFFNFHQVFHWSAPEAASDAILKAKAPYLNVSFFVIRFIGIFIISWLFYFFIIRNSRKQDVSREQFLTKRNITLSGAFIPVFAILISIMSLDWLMSLEPHWFSTIFCVYYFAGSLLAAIAALTFIVVSLNERGYLIKGLTEDHYYSLGGLMFAFTNFWAYIAFSQFLLIWYANLPEENFWFINRMNDTWSYISVGLIVLKFVMPYALLASQPSKMNPGRLKLAAFWILGAQYYDLFWLAIPNYYKTGPALHWTDFGFPLLAIGVIMTVFCIVARGKNLVPIGDPKLKRSMDFHL
ncbi:MAG: actF [Ignavibacteria bacterium]|nr:actF [Ignavibacteria bacterium]